MGNSLEILTGQTEDGQRLFDLGASTAQKSLGAIPGAGNFAGVGRLPAVRASVSGCVASTFTA